MILEGDCIEEMAKLDEASVDAVVCDPPYGLEFMGKAWDGADGFRRSLNPADVARDDAFGRASRTSPEYRAGRLFQDWSEKWATEALRVLKPGGHLLAFGGTRTYHRLACAVEDAGFEIRDSLLWLYGSGFPKSLDVSKAIDKAAGHWRGQAGAVDSENAAMAGPNYERTDKGDPVTPAAAAAGWGTALKPSHEPIVVARKPLAGTVAQNWAEYGTGALNIDGCRIGTAGADDYGRSAARADGKVHPGLSGYGGGERSGHEQNTSSLGRWPANVILSPEAAEALDEQTGDVKGAVSNGKIAGTGYEGGFRGQAQEPGYADSGGPSRFFYCAKTSRAERNAGLEGFEASDDFRTQGSGRVPLSRCPEHGESQPSGSLTYRCGCERVWDGREGKPKPVANVHPTVKPINLMRWLVRLVTPPGGLVLDPFLGSGTTGCAAALEGFDFVGIEREAEYVAIAEARIAFWEQHVGREVEDVLEVAGRSERERAEHAERGQLSIEAAA